MSNSIKEDNNLDKINSKKDSDSPLVSILMAVYKPNEKWLIEQLISLNEQTYENIELLVYDDCPEHPISEVLIGKHITNFSYVVISGIKNEGSNKAFEELTKIANGEFFAYCDQDDIWEKEKIEYLLSSIRKENAMLAYSDMSVIDGYGKIIADTLKKIRPRLQYIHGSNLMQQFFFSNCIAGCCMLVDSRIAKNAIPFSNVTVHDQWICIVASFYGKIVFLDKQLIKYRIHGNNQTGILTGVYNKTDYYNIRLIPLKQRIEEVKRCLKLDKLGEIEEFYEARINRSIFGILKYKDLSKKEAYFEILIKYMPNWLFKIIIKKLK